MPERMCIVSRVVKPEAELIRFALSPEGKVVPDLARKLPGRGVWVSLDPKAIAEAQKRKLFAKGFGAEAEADVELPELVAKLLRQETVSRLALTRKAGLAIAGNTKVEEALAKGKVKLLLHLKGAGADGTIKLNRKAPEGTVICDLLSAQELDLAFGRENVVHAGVAGGGLTEKLLDSLRRWAQYSGFTMNGTDKRR
ncbi:MAG: RNA-binding protein [Aestuariivirga sp.]